MGCGAADMPELTMNRELLTHRSLFMSGPRNQRTAGRRLKAVSQTEEPPHVVADLLLTSVPVKCVKKQEAVRQRGRRYAGPDGTTGAAERLLPVVVNSTPRRRRRRSSSTSLLRRRRATVSSRSRGILISAARSQNR